MYCIVLLAETGPKTPYFMKTSYSILPTPLFQILSNCPFLVTFNPPPPWVMILWIYSCWALVPYYQKDLDVGFIMQQGVKFTEFWHMWFFTGTLIGYHTQTHIQRHTALSGASRFMHTYKYILTPVMCSQQLSLCTNICLHHLLYAHSSHLYYIEWIILWYQKIAFHDVFSFQQLFT